MGKRLPVLWPHDHTILAPVDGGERLLPSRGAGRSPGMAAVGGPPVGSRPQPDFDRLGGWDAAQRDTPGRGLLRMSAPTMTRSGDSGGGCAASPLPAGRGRVPDHIRPAASARHDVCRRPPGSP